MKKSCFLMMLLLLLSTGSLNAQWTKVDGPFGGVSAGAIIAKDNNIFAYLNTGQAGVYRSRDNGETWESLDSNFFQFKAVQQFFVDNETLYAATTKGLVHSEDNGETWVDDSTSTGYSFVLSVEKLDSQLYVGTTGGILVNNLADSLGWVECNGGLTNSITNDLITDNDFIFAATYDGIFRKNALDSAWTKLTNGLPESTIMYTLAAKDSLIFASSSTHTYRSSDLGETWTQLTLPLENRGTDFAVLNGKLFLATMAGVLVSDDNGDSWREISTGLPFGARYCIDLTSYEDRLFLSTAWGIYHSDNIDEKWIKIDMYIDNLNISDLKTDGNTLYALTSGDGVYRTSLDDINWEWFIDGLDDSNPNTLFLDEENIYLGYRNGFYSYSSQEQIWNSFNDGFNDDGKYDFFDVKSISRIGNFLFAGTDGPGLCKANRDTLVWTPIELEIPTIESQATRDSTIYAAVENGYLILKSEDFGENWDVAADQVFWMLNSKLYNFDNTIYAACMNGVFYLPENDTNWIDLSYNLEYKMCNYLAKNDEGLFASVGNSLSWLPTSDTVWIDITGDLPTSNNYAIALSPESIYVAPSRSGVWSAPLADFQTDIDRDPDLSQIPGSFMLRQNYPNPFNPTTTIEYSMLKRGNISIQIYDIHGELLETLLNENKEIGNYNVTWNADNYSSGIYFYRFESNGFVDTKKCILMK